MTLTAASLIAMLSVLCVALVAGAAARGVGQPTVVGTIVGGLLVGSLLEAGPAAWNSGPLAQGMKENLHFVGQIGLVLFMLEVGRELRQRGVRLRAGRLAAALSVGFAVPVVTGALAAIPLLTFLTADGGSRVWTCLFVALALTVTAVPVLASILAERPARGDLGPLALSVAVLNDGMVWLGVILVSVAAGIRVVPPGVAALCLGLLTLLLLAFRRLGDRVAAGNANAALAVIAVCTLAAAALTEVVGLHVALGALLAGIACPTTEAVDRACATLHRVSIAILLPIFFADAAAKVPLQQVFTGGAAFVAGVGLLVVVATVSKLLVGVLLGRVARLPAGDGVVLGVLLNCRGVTELAIASIGLQLGLVGPLGFAALALVALITTTATTPGLRLLERRQGDRRSEVPASALRPGAGPGAAGRTGVPIPVTSPSTAEDRP